MFGRRPQTSSHHPNPCANHQAPHGYYYVWSTRRGGGCVLAKRRTFRGVFGAVKTPPNTDPFTPAPNPPHLPPINCGRHQAPHGYYYKLVAGRCMLWRKDPHTPVILPPRSQAGVGFIYQTPTVASAQNTITNTTNWIGRNKGLALALGIGAYYIFTKK